MICACGRPRYQPHDMVRWRALEFAGIVHPEPAWARAICWSDGPIGECMASTGPMADRRQAVAMLVAVLVVISQLFALQANRDALTRIGNVLAGNGCDCDVDEDHCHDDDGGSVTEACCLGHRIEAAWLLQPVGPAAE